ncbi:hypothetical protein [Methylobacter sp.]|uniref:hypothetical protein n=1 Tax=Methylobacter sp. TaxID=2051955 RepID=UPI003DA69757
MYYRRKMAMLALAGIGFGKNIAAAEWELTGDLGQQLEYNDNISLNTVRNDSVAGYILMPSVQASRKTGVLDIAFDGQGDIRRYDDSLWDCDNYRLRLNNEYRTRRNEFGLRAEYNVSCSYAQQTTDTGLLVPNSQSEEYLVAPQWNWQWTARDQLVLNALYSKTSYSNPTSGFVSDADNVFVNFSGNDTYSASLGGNHEWTRRLTSNERVYYSNIQYTGLNSSIQNASAQNESTQNLVGFELGANYIINHEWAVNVSGGPVWVDGTGQNLVGTLPAQDSSWTVGSNVNINLSYNDKLTKFSTGYSNSVDPSAIGQTLQNHSVFLKYSYQLTRHVLLDLSGDFINNQSINGSQSTGSQFDRLYFTTAAGIAWEPTRNWRLKGSYIYSWQDYQQDLDVQNFRNVQGFQNVGTSDSNAVMLFLNYSWDGIRNSTGKGTGKGTGEEVNRNYE